MRPLAILAGGLLDFLLGDPYWLPHPVRWIGKMIAFLERKLRMCFPATPKGEMAGGSLLVIAVCLSSFLLPLLVLFICGKIHWGLRLAVETWMIYQILAAKCLQTESRKVYRQLQEKNLPGARKQLSFLVGRDTQELTEKEVICAAVETVAENTTDGVIAPLLFIAVGGAPLGMLYKAINTMDSMLGYRNEAYRYFGKFAARLDDAANWVPARLAGLLMCLSAGVLRLSMPCAFRIFFRDRGKHLSPNSAQTESACAGALGIALGGTHVYFGKPVEKPMIGDASREPDPKDILRANHLMLITQLLFLLLMTAGYALFFFCWGGKG